MIVMVQLLAMQALNALVRIDMAMSCTMTIIVVR